MLEVVVNYLYPALTTVKTDWLFLCTPDSVMFAASRPPAPPPDATPVPSPHKGLFQLEIPFTYFEAWSRKRRQLTSLAHSCS